MLSIIPITAISSGLGIFIPLYILYLKGNVFDIGLAFAFYNLVSIPSALFWGKITDIYGKSKPFILLSVFLTIPILLLFGFSQQLNNTYIYYSLFAVIATAASPALNILVMGTKRNKTLPKYFSRYSLFGLIGSIVAYGFGASLAINNPSTYLYLLIYLNIAAAILALILIKDQPREIKNSQKITLANNLFPLLNSITALPILMISSDTVIRIRNTIKSIEKKRIYQLLGAIILFNFGYYIFNTSYVPYLNGYGLSYANIFAINLANVVAQIIIFIAIIKIKKSLKLERGYMLSITYRSTGYVIAAAAMFFPMLFFSVNIIAYAIAGFSYALWNLSSSVLLYDMIRGKKEGYYVGLWTGLLGGSAVLGAMLSGVITVVFGYQSTFLIATAVTLGSGLIFHKKFDSK